MPKSKTPRNPFQKRKSKSAARKATPKVHIYGNKVLCDTDTRGFATPGGRSRTEIVVDATEGFIPLWSKNTILRWRFQEHSLGFFQNPEAAKGRIRELLGQALLEWGDAAPVKFSERNDLWDFEIVVREDDRCSINGCVLASAFFPDSGRHELVIYPKMFEQSAAEQLETICHEIGHIFGLRHFFANVSENAWPSEIFGEHERFSIMNYGDESQLTELDKEDLKSMYTAVWDGRLEKINGTKIRQVKPYSVS